MTRRGLLQLAAAALPVHAAKGGVIETTLRAQPDGYNGRIPGPVLEARPGDTVRLRLVNALKEFTNLHFHGLHVPPSVRADSPFLRVEPGAAWDYEFQIPARHPGGMYWIHPQVHGLAARQVAAGLASPFILRGELDQLPEIAAATEHLLVLQDILTEEPSMRARYAGRRGPRVTVNGATHPAFAIQRDGLARLRLLNASASRFYRLKLEQHPLHLIGGDGGPLPAPVSVEEVVLAPGQRADALVRGEREAGAYRLLDGAAPLATLTYRGRSPTPWQVPGRLVSFTPLAAPGGPRRVFVLRQVMSAAVVLGRGVSFSINGKSYDPERSDTAVRLNGVEEWQYDNPTATDQPMHLHTNAFQVVDAAGQAQPGWKDTVVVKAGASARLRVRFADFAGRTVHHGAVLDRADLGMAAVVEIQA